MAPGGGSKKWVPVGQAAEADHDNAPVKARGARREKIPTNPDSEDLSDNRYDNGKGRRDKGGKDGKGRFKGYEDNWDKGNGKDGKHGKGKDDGWGKSTRGKDGNKGHKGKDDFKGGKGDRGFDKGGKVSSGKGKSDSPPDPPRRTDDDEDTVVKKRTQDAPMKKPVDAKGQRCEVHKHSGMGCAVVTFEVHTAREAVMKYADVHKTTEHKGNPVLDIVGVPVQLRRHTDKSTQREVLTDIFIAWGHKAEKDRPLTAEEITEFFDTALSEAPAQGPLSTSPPSASPPPGAPPPPVGVPRLPQAFGNPMAGYGPGYNHAYYQQWYAAQQAHAAYAAQHAQYQRAQYAAAAAQNYPYQQQQSQSWQQHVAAAQAAAAAMSGGSPAAAPGTPSSAVTSPNKNAKEFVPQQQKFRITDPSTGSVIDTLGMNFEKAEKTQGFPIVDPNSGDAVQLGS